MVTKLYIMCGLAFSGKSTLARKIAEKTDSDLVAFDQLWVLKDKEKPISKDADGWRFIRKVAQEEVAKKLTDGKSVVYDDNNVKKEHRDELQRVAKNAGVGAVVVYLNTPLEIIRQREQANRTSHERHEVEPENFNTVLEQLEPPMELEGKVIEFTPETNLENFLDNL